MVTIDGGMGEGGGQVLRTALSLSLVTGVPLRVENIRAGRHKPGILRQHLVCVRAAKEIGAARVRGDELGSTQIDFAPTARIGGTYKFAIGSAGSTTLVLQTILPALLRADAPSEVAIEGGTHNPLAPPYEFVERAYLPVLEKMGARVALALERPGFHPAGGGRLVARVTPSALAPLVLERRTTPVRITAKAIVSALPGAIAVRELARVRERLGLDGAATKISTVDEPRGPGNVVVVEVASPEVTEVMAALGEKGLPAEKVADRACDQVAAHLATDAPAGEYLADQLLLPMALAGGGAFRASCWSSHASTQAALIPQFLPVRIEVEPEPGETVRVTVRSR